MTTAKKERPAAPDLSTAVAAAKRLPSALLRKLADERLIEELAASVEANDAFEVIK